MRRVIFDTNVKTPHRSAMWCYFLRLEIRGPNISRFNISRLNKDALWISLIYVLAHGLMLLNRGIFWDDWVWYMMDTESLIDVFSQWGNVYVGYYYNFVLRSDNSIFAFRAIIFLSYLISALLLNDVMKSIREIDDTSRFILVVLFAVFPVNSARTLISCSFYAVGYFMFFLGAWLTCRYMGRRTILLRLTTLSIFFLSFFVNSILFFYVLVLLYILYRESRVEPRLLSLPKTSLKYADFFLLPLVFWTIRYLFFLPYGLYQGYNTIYMTNLYPENLTRNLITSFYHSIVLVFLASFQSLSAQVLSQIMMFIFFFFIVFLILRKRDINKGNDKHVFKTFAIGCSFFAVGIFPYLVVGKPPVPFSLDSRHELLVPLGASFVVYYGLRIVSKGASFVVYHGLRIVSRKPILFPPLLLRSLILSLMIALFVTSNIVTYLDYQKDWYKQQSLIENLRSSDIIRNHTTFIFVDHSADLNIYGRGYRFYEYSSMMEYTFGDETRFGCDAAEFYLFNYFQRYSIWNFRDYEPHEPEYVVNIYKGDYAVDKNLLKLMFYELFAPEKFKSAVRKIIAVGCDKLPSYSNSSSTSDRTRFIGEFPRDFQHSLSGSYWIDLTDVNGTSKMFRSEYLR